MSAKLPDNARTLAARGGEPALLTTAPYRALLAAARECIGQFPRLADVLQNWWLAETLTGPRETGRSYDEGDFALVWAVLTDLLDWRGEFEWKKSPGQIGRRPIVDVPGEDPSVDRRPARTAAATRSNPAPPAGGAEPAELSAGAFRSLRRAVASFTPLFPGLDAALRTWWLTQILPGPVRPDHRHDAGDLPNIWAHLTDLLAWRIRTDRAKDAGSPERAPYTG